MVTRSVVVLWLAGALLAHAASVVTRPSTPEDQSASGSSSAPTFSPDGKQLLFVSAAVNLTTNYIQPGSLNIYVRELSSAHTMLVSLGTNNAGADGASAWPTVSRNGRYVAFQSDAPDIVVNDTNGLGDIFVRDTLAQTTVLVSTGFFTETFAAGPHSNPQISSNGTWVFFESTGTLTPGADANGGKDVFARNLQDQTLRLISGRASDGAAANRPATLASVTPDGRRVAFISGAWNQIVPGAGYEGGSDVYVRDMQNNTVSWISPLTSHMPVPYICDSAALSDDASHAVITASAFGRRSVFRRNLATGVIDVVSTNAWVNSFPQISSDSRFVLHTDGTNLFRWDAVTAVSELVSRTTNNATPVVGITRTGRMASNGGKIVFISSSPGLTTNDAGVGFQIYLRNMQSGETRLFSMATNRSGSQYSCEDAMLDINSESDRVAFSTAASDLVAGDFNRAADVFVFDTQSDKLEFVTQRAAGFPVRQTALGHSYITASGISSNATLLAFASYDTDLTSSATNGAQNAFVADVNTGSVTLLTDDQGRAARTLALSADGRFLLTARMFGMFGGDQIVRHDLAAGTNHVLVTGSRPWDGAAPAINGSGQLIAYVKGNSVFFSVVPFVVLNADGMTNEYSVELRSLAPLNAGDLRDAAFTPDSRFVVYAATNTLYMWDRVDRELQSVSFDRTNSVISVSANSRFLTFNNPATQRRDLLAKTNLALGHQLRDTTISGDGRFIVGATGSFSAAQVVLVDCESGETNLVSVTATGQPGNSHSRYPVISADGRYIAYRTRATNIVPGAKPLHDQVVLRDRTLGTTTLLSSGPDGAPGNRSSSKPILSQDGSTIVFQSMAENLIAGDYNDRRDIFVVKLGLGDSDGDGMDDEWEQVYFDGLSRTGEADFDSDGMSDRDEFRAGTDPTNGGSVFRVVRLQRLDAASVQLIWIGNSSKQYRVEYKETLNAAAWAPLDVPITWNMGTATAIDPSGGQSRFYRVVSLP